MRIYQNPFSEAGGLSVNAFDLPVISSSLSASPATSAILSSQITDTTGMEFSALHSATCCACGQNHQTLKLYLAQAESDGGGAPVAQSSGAVYAEGDVPGDTNTTETLAVGGSVTDTIEVSGDQDWFAVNLVAGQRYLVTLTGTGADPLDDPYLEVMDSEGNQVRFNDDSGDGLNSSLYFVPETSGTYYVNAHGWEDDQGNTSTGEYTVTLEEAEDIGTYTFDEIANFITQEFDTPHRWADTDLTYDVSGLSAGAQILAIRALETWADMTNLTFTEDTGNADITFQNTESGAYASTSYGGTDSEGYYIITSSTVNVAADWFGGDVSLDSYTYQTFLHEIGHALGLGHSGPYNSNATYGQDNIYINDNWSYSLMSYFDQAEAGFGNYRFALAPQIADILAIQTLYEVNPDGTRTGNTTYGFNSTESDINDWSQFVVVQPEGTYVRPPSYAIYDTGGVDTIDLSGYTRGQTLSLIPETFSSLGDRPDNNSPVYVNSVSIARGTIIENAIGGSGNDTFITNSADNRLTGNAGADRYVFMANGGTDTVTDFNASQDILDFSKFDEAAALAAFDARTTVNGNAQITINGQTVILLGVSASSLTAANIVTSSEVLELSARDDTFTTTERANISGNLFADNGNGVDATPSGSLSIEAVNGESLTNGSITIALAAGGQIVVNSDGSFTTQLGTAYAYLSSSEAPTVAFTYTVTNGTQTDVGAVALTIQGQDWVATPGDDVIYGTNGFDSIGGQEGDDLIFAGLGDDRLFGSLGNDYIDGEGGNDRIVGNEGNDNLFGRDGNDTIFGGSGEDRIFGGDGNDKLTGEADDDRIAGGLGNDDIYGRNGFDSLSGNEGDDRIFGGNDGDFIDGGAGRDRLVGGGGNDNIFGRTGNDSISGQAGDDRIFGGEGVDFLDGGDGTDQIRGGADGDTLYGRDGNDLLYADAGDDRVYAGNDDDSVDGGTGDDRILGGAGNDNLYGRDGNDMLLGEDGADRIFGAIGEDVIDGGTGNDYLAGGDDTDSLYGRDGNDEMYGDGGADRMFGGNGDDLMLGGEGGDRIVGGDGSDRLFGNEGSDTLQGDAGSDFYTGGLGTDTFVVHGTDLGNTTDRINDFSTSEDIIRLVDSGITTFAQLQTKITATSNGVSITLNSGDVLEILGVAAGDLDASHFEFATSSEPVGDKLTVSEQLDAYLMSDAQISTSLLSTASAAGAPAITEFFLTDFDVLNSPSPSEIDALVPPSDTLDIQHTDMNWTSLDHWDHFPV